MLVDFIILTPPTSRRESPGGGFSARLLSRSKTARPVSSLRRSGKVGCIHNLSFLVKLFPVITSIHDDQVGTMASPSWKDLVKVNGSFYCNLSEAAEPPDNNNDIRTIVRIGEDEADSLEASGPESFQHTIKLVIGGSTEAQPLSLDTSEYVSWDGSSSQAGERSPLPQADSLDEDEEEEEEDDVDPVVAVHPPTLVEDELTHTCREFFDHRQRKVLQLRGPSVESIKEPAPLITAGLQDKMEHLRREIVSVQDCFIIRSNKRAVAPSGVNKREKKTSKIDACEGNRPTVGPADSWPAVQKWTPHARLIMPKYHAAEQKQDTGLTPFLIMKTTFPHEAFLGGIPCCWRAYATISIFYFEKTVRDRERNRWLSSGYLGFLRSPESR